MAPLACTYGVHLWHTQVRSIDASGDVGLSANTGLIATGNGSGEAAVWDVASRTKLRAMKCGGMVYSVDLTSPYIPLHPLTPP